MTPQIVVDSELIKRVSDEILASSREEFEPWRATTTDALKDSRCIEVIAEGCMQWFNSQLAAGRPINTLFLGLAGGMISSAFQLGLCVAEAKYKEKYSESLYNRASQ